MANIFSYLDKNEMRHALFDTAIEVLEREGWSVEREPGYAPSVRRIERGPDNKLVAIKTVLGDAFAFVPEGRGWKTLDDVDLVAIAGLDDMEKPRFVKVHLVEAKEIRERLIRNRDARQKAGHKIRAGHGIWVGLYREEKESDARLAGSGVGRAHPPIAVVPIQQAPKALAATRPISSAPPPEAAEPPLTIADAKRRLAAAHETTPDKVKITIEW